jgi:putative oxidoreductase
MKDVLDLLGRFFIAVFFYFEAFDSVFYFRDTREKMTAYGLTWKQDTLLLGAIIFLIFGSTLVLIGYRAAFGAFLLFAYWLPVSLIVHSFWNDPPVQQREALVDLMRNMAICGGLFLIIANGAGRYSVKRLFSTIKVAGT